MRKIFFIIPFLLYISSVSAQQFRFGLKASPLLTWMKSEDNQVSHAGIKAGFNYGLTFEYFLTDNYGASTGITITHKGGKINYEDSTYTRFRIKTSAEEVKPDSFRRPKLNFSTQYVEIPIMLKLKTNEIGYMTYFGQFGISPGINIRTKADIKGEQREAVDVNLIKDMNTFNLSLHMGAGFEYSLGGNTSLLLGLYFNNGFVDVTKFDKNKVILNHLALRLGILF